MPLAYLMHLRHTFIDKGVIRLVMFEQLSLKEEESSFLHLAPAVFLSYDLLKISPFCWYQATGHIWVLETKSIIIFSIKLIVCVLQVK